MLVRYTFDFQDVILFLAVAFQHTTPQDLKCSHPRLAIDSLFVIAQALLVRQFCSFVPKYLNLNDLVELVSKLFVD